jgi:hypothetical protein
VAYSCAQAAVLRFGRSQSAAQEEAMNYSSAAERVIEAVNRLLIAAMTSAWTSALSHQHVAPPEVDDGNDVGSSLGVQNSSAPEGADKQH